MSSASEVAMGLVVCLPGRRNDSILVQKLQLSQLLAASVAFKATSALDVAVEVAGPLWVLV